MNYRVNKQKCLGVNRCGICLRNCTGAAQEGNDNKAEIIDQQRLEQCGGVGVCPMGAIEMVDQEETQTKEIEERPGLQFVPTQRKGLGMGGGRGMGAGRGRGMGLGPRDGRGGGRGGGGRRG